MTGLYFIFINLLRRCRYSFQKYTASRSDALNIFKFEIIFTMFVKHKDLLISAQCPRIAISVQLQKSNSVTSSVSLRGYELADADFVQGASR